MEISHFTRHTGDAVCDMSEKFDEVSDGGRRGRAMEGPGPHGFKGGEKDLAELSVKLHVRCLSMEMQDAMSMTFRSDRS